MYFKHGVPFKQSFWYDAFVEILPIGNAGCEADHPSGSHVPFTDMGA